MFAKILAWFNGKKTYITAAVAAVCAVLQANGVMIPEWVYALLAAVGITFVRAAIK
jgi:hypothetical protein